MSSHSLICPRCGTVNSPGAVNCVACRINLEFARENPAQIERIRLDATGPGAGIEPSGVQLSGQASVLLPVLLLLGSFTFAYLLGETVHEFGHYLAHRLYGSRVAISLDPFGGSMTHGSGTPRETWGATSAAGPLLNLFAGIILTLSLWSKRKPALLPLLFWGPIALIQEGVTLSLGMLTPGGDALLIVEWGVPAPILLGLGMLSLASGVALLCWLLPLVGLSPADSLGRKLSVVAGGMVSFLFIRFLVSSLADPELAMENFAPLLFSILLAALVVGLFEPLYSLLKRISVIQPVPVTRAVAASSLTLGLAIVLFQLLTFP